MSSITEAKSSASLDDGILTLENGKTIDLGKIESILNQIADQDIPGSNDEEHDMLVDCQSAAQMGPSSFRVERDIHNWPLVVEPGGHVGRLHLSLSTCPPGSLETGGFDERRD